MKAATAVATLATAACALATGRPAAHSPASAPIGGTARLAGMKVTPIALLEDSRCPLEVVCVWAGRLRVRARIQFAGRTELADLELGKPVAVIPGRRVVLTGAIPERSSGAPIAREAYLFSFAME